MITQLTEGYTPTQLKSILHPLVNRWFFGKFLSFSPPQLFGVMDIHQRKNILISAPTGSGKTLTAFLAILNELVDTAQKQVLENRIYAVYVSPLKALNYDIEKNLLEPLAELEALAEKQLGIRVGVRTGDTTQYQRSKMTKLPPHILITTPESLAILINSPKFKLHLAHTQWLLVDEIHALAENKRGVHFSVTMERLQKVAPGLTRVGLSATIAPLEEIARFLVGYQGEDERDCGVVDVQFLKNMDLQVISPVRSLVNTDYLLKHKKMYETMHELIGSHKTTLIFTNTRSATERVVHNLKEMYPQAYGDNIAAHHGSLSKDMRFTTEAQLREGKLKVVACSTSLELGIDIGYIDLVLCLGSPKSVARFLQRAGRAGHQLHSTIKARILVMDRDDLVECSLLLKAAIEKKIDRVHLPRNALDVLAQHIFGIAINGVVNIYKLFHFLQQSYAYHTLTWENYFAVIKYLAGDYVSLEERYVFARIWYDEQTGNIGRRGKLARVTYMTNIGTIPAQSHVLVKVGDHVVGKIDEGFLERLRPGDVFVLGGSVYKFRFSRGMTAQVDASVNRPPTVPSWFSEMLPLSYDLAMSVGRFRRLMDQRFLAKQSRKEIIAFITRYLYVDDKAATSLYQYFSEQFHFSIVPSDHQLLIESFKEKDQRYVVFHSLYGRRVNDCFSRALAYVIGKHQHRDVEVGITDNGFYLSAAHPFNARLALQGLLGADIDYVLNEALERSEVLKRRFRHCAARSLMILQNYRGRQKSAGKMQIGSRLLYSAVKKISKDFPILKEARREVLEDLMDVEHFQEVLTQLRDKKIKIVEKNLGMPSPFAFGLVLAGYSDVIRIEDKHAFLKRLHAQVLAKIALKQGKLRVKEKEFSYQEFWEAQHEEEKQDSSQQKLKFEIWALKNIPVYVKEEMIKILDGKSIRRDVRALLREENKESWTQELRDAIESYFK